MYEVDAVIAKKDHSEMKSNIRPNDINVKFDKRKENNKWHITEKGQGKTNFS